MKVGDRVRINWPDNIDHHNRVGIIFASASGGRLWIVAIDMGRYAYFPFNLVKLDPTPEEQDTQRREEHAMRYL